MTEIRIKVTDDMGKAEEIEIIDRLTRFFEDNPNNYLASLFTKEMAGWIQNAISNDFPPDAYQYILAYNSGQPTDREKQLQQEVDDLTQTVAEAGEENDTLEADNNDLKENVKALQESLEKTIAERNSESELAYDARQTADDRADQIEKMEAEIVRLKAEIYDLMKQQPK